MFRILHFTHTLLLAIVALAGCESSDGESMQTSADAGDLMTADAPSTAGDTIVMTVHGMSCPLCATNVDKQLLRVRGVHSVEVDLSTGAVTMLVSEVSPPTDAQLMRAVEESGFTVAEPPRRP